MTDAAPLRSDLQKVVDDLLAGTKAGDGIDLDAIGDAIGTKLVSQDEIDRVMSALEAAGRTIKSPSGAGEGEAALKTVLSSARKLRAELGRAPRAEEIAGDAGLSLTAVKHALDLARIMQR